MPNFSYKAINENGTRVTGNLEAETLGSAENILISRGYIPEKIAEVANEGGGNSFTADLILFTKQFRSMMQAGIPILRLLQVLEHQTQNNTMKKVITEIGQDIKSGATLYGAMRKHPTIFPPLYLSMINAGEISGTVPDILERLINIIEHEAKIKADIKSALQYPIMVLAALVIAFFVLLTFVIPKFATIFTKTGMALPLPTKIAMLLYQIISDYWFILIGGAILLIIVLRAYFKTAAGLYARDTFFLKLPLFGPLFQKAAMARFASIFAILQASGIPVMQTMEIISGTIGNAAISHEFELVRSRIQEGQGISGPLGAAKYFSPMVVDMVAIGEESGNIEDMLRQVAIHYDEEVNYSVKSLADAIGPVLMVGLAAVVGFFAMAIFLPMWDLTKMVK
jgi:type II secretory pathway component PulF